MITNKANKEFVKFDIVNLNPSIKYDKLAKALAFLANLSTSYPTKWKLLYTPALAYWCQTLSDADGYNWIKASNEIFDVAMGSYIGTEICD